MAVGHHASITGCRFTTLLQREWRCVINAMRQQKSYKPLISYNYAKDRKFTIKNNA